MVLKMRSFIVQKGTPQKLKNGDLAGVGVQEIARYRLRGSLRVYVTHCLRSTRYS